MILIFSLLLLIGHVASTITSSGQAKFNTDPIADDFYKSLDLEKVYIRRAAINMNAEALHDLLREDTIYLLEYPYKRAFRLGNTTQMQWLLQFSPGMANLQLKSGVGTEIDKQQFIDAVERGDVDSTRRFIESGVEVNLEDQYGRPMLIVASDRGHTEVAKLLLDAGADMEIGCNNEYDLGRRSLSFAARRGNAEIVAMLLEAGADVNARRPESMTTALMVATLWGIHDNHLRMVQVVKLLLIAGADIHVVSVQGYTALLWAHDAKIARLLVDAGADVNVATDHGTTVLIIAAVNHRTEIVKILVEAGADVHAIDNSGRTALMAAQRALDCLLAGKKCIGTIEGFREIIDILQAKANTLNFVQAKNQ